jgi:hypothetical protein
MQWIPASRPGAELLDTLLLHFEFKRPTAPEEPVCLPLQTASSLTPHTNLTQNSAVLVSIQAAEVTESARADEEDSPVTPLALPRGNQAPSSVAADRLRELGYSMGAKSIGAQQRFLARRRRVQSALEEREKFENEVSRKRAREEETMKKFQNVPK